MKFPTKSNKTNNRNMKKNKKGYSNVGEMYEISIIFLWLLFNPKSEHSRARIIAQTCA